MSRSTDLAGAAGAVALVVALSPPLDGAAHDVFAAHMVQHLALTHAVAPLLLLGRVHRRAARLAPIGVRRRWGRRLARVARGRGPAGGVVVTGVHVLVVLAWHLPVLYDLALAVPAVHVLEHLLLLGSALGFWAALGAGSHRPVPLGALLAFAASLGLGALAALLSVAPAPLYAAHAATGGPWGLSALQDQQLGGAIMWIPGGLVYLAAAVTTVVRWIGADERRPAAGHPR